MTTPVRRRTVAIIQARLGSTRLPGKVLADLGGATMLACVIQRARACRVIDDVVVATTRDPADDAVAREAAACGAAVVRGPEDDVLARYLVAARASGADVIVRITSDCPLLDPDVVGAVAALSDTVDYASNTHRRTFPRGLDVEALHRDTLERIGRLGRSRAAREHVTAYVMEEPSLFRIDHFLAASDDSDLRWTVDTEADLAMVRGLYAAFDLGARILPYAEVVAAVRANPRLASANAHVIQKPWWKDLEVDHVS
jgi:spore coat polysaccharide biosynthesis protein SpsF